MLPIRPMTPAHASIASLSVVFPDDAWPTVAKLRRSPADGVAINQTRSCSKHASNSPRTQAQISGRGERALWSDVTPMARRDWIHWITSAKKKGKDARAPDQLRTEDCKIGG